CLDVCAAGALDGRIMRWTMWAATLCVCWAGNSFGQNDESLKRSPNGLGVNIHFTNAGRGELEQLAAGGFKFIRMDLSWAHTEKDDGSYDFSHYDALLDDLDTHRIRAILILD